MWIGEPTIHLQLKVFCGTCYDQAKAFHMADDVSSLEIIENHPLSTQSGYSSGSI